MRDPTPNAAEVRRRAKTRGKCAARPTYASESSARARGRWGRASQGGGAYLGMEMKR
jgi:hypothetical protein